MKYSRFLIALSLLVPSATLPASAKETHATIVYDDVATEIASARQESGQLWVTTADLTRATKFKLKPQGACRDELCFPIPKGRTSEFENTAGGKKFFNLTAFADQLSAGARFHPARYAGQTPFAFRLSRQKGAAGHLGLLVRMPS